MNTTETKTARTVTIEMNSRQWALFACALSVGFTRLDEASDAMGVFDKADHEYVYRTVSEAVFPE